MVISFTSDLFESDDLTATEILNYHGKGLATLADASANRVYSDDVLSQILQTVVQFVEGNAPSGVNLNLARMAIKDLCKVELNNRMYEDGLLPRWKPLDTYDREYLSKALETKSEGDDPGLQLYVHDNVTEW